MTGLSIPSIFWTSLAAIVAILSLATLIGRSWCAVLPYRFRAHTSFYLAPALGLASLTIVASLVGRILPLGNSVVVPWLVFVMLVWAIVHVRDKMQAFRHAFLVGIFGIVCGVSMLSPLFAYGGFNAHNDTFTYLTHSNWLQLRAFGETIPAEMVSPLTTQISLYQQHGFRMGGSFLLALLQALLNLQWSYEVYPAVIISAIAACCLAIGFPLAQTLGPMRRCTRLALLALPAFSLGGLVFGANFGFFPQTVGLALGAGSLFMVGPLFKWVTNTNAPWRTIGKAALPSAALFSGATFAYSELAPFLLVAIVGSGFALALRFHALKKMLTHGGVLLGISALLLNTEMVRAYAALRMQSGIVVGSPVDWSLLGYAAHAFGIHGGAWDLYQWTTPGGTGSIVFAVGLVLLGFAAVLVLSGTRPIWRATLSGALMPSVAVLIIFAVGIVYFRYFVPSPFPKGLGQSWSQFKLADWAHPFVMAPVLLAISSLRPLLGKIFDGAVVAIFGIGIVSAAFIGVDRVAPLMHYYSGVSDLNRFYLKFRDTVRTACPLSTPVYLALGGAQHKFREMASLYLFDREVRSDWTDDTVIYPHLPTDRRMQELQAGSCVVERNGQGSWLSKGAQVGPFIVGVVDGRGQISIASVAGAYGRETDGQNWWHWVERKVNFKLQPLFIPKDANRTRLSFEYATRGKQTLALRIIKSDRTSQDFLLQSDGDARSIFDTVVDLPPKELVEISIETDGAASPLGQSDRRVAAWIVRNLNITPVIP